MKIDVMIHDFGTFNMLFGFRYKIRCTRYIENVFSKMAVLFSIIRKKMSKKKKQMKYL